MHELSRVGVDNAPPGSEDYEVIRRLEALVPWEALAKMARDKLTTALDDILGGCADEIQTLIEQSMANNAAWNVSREATTLASVMFSKVLAGDVGAFQDMVSATWPSQNGTVVQDLWSTWGGRTTPKLDDVIAARRALLCAHADLFERIVVADWERERDAYLKEIDRLKAEVGRLRAAR